MQDLFANAAETETRSTDLIDAIIERATGLGFCIRIEDAAGNNMGLESRNAGALKAQYAEAAQSMTFTTLHIIDKRGDFARYQCRIAISHKGPQDAVQHVEGDRNPEAAAIITAPLDDEADDAQQEAMLAQENAQEGSRWGADPEKKPVGHFPRHLAPVEAKIINKLLTAALNARLTIRVFDGEEWAGPATRDRAQIQSQTAATDETTYYLADWADGSHCGTVSLIHGNGEDVISDYGWKRGDEAARIVLERITEAAA